VIIPLADAIVIWYWNPDEPQDMLPNRGAPRKQHLFLMNFYCEVGRIMLL